MKKIFWLQIFVANILLTACATLNAQPTMLHTETSELLITSITQAIPPDEDQIFSTPTIMPYTLAKTPQAQPLSIINETNVLRISEIARWGLGSYLDAIASSDHQLIALMHSQGVLIYSTKELKEVAEIITPFEVTEFAFSVDATKAGLASQTGDVWLVDTKTGDVLQQYHYPLWDLRSIALSPDENYLLVGSGDGTIFQPITGGTPINTPMLEIPAHSLTISPDGTLLASAFDGPIEIRETGTWQVKQVIQNTDWVEGLTFSADGSLLVGHVRNKLVIWRTADGSVWASVSAIDHEQFDPLETVDPVFALNGDWSKVVFRYKSIEGARLRLVSLPDRELLKEISPENFEIPVFVIFDSFSNGITAILEETGSELPFRVVAWNVEEKTLSQRMVISRQMTSLSASEDGNLLAAGMSNGTVLLLDAHSGELNFKGDVTHENEVQAVQFGEGYQKLISAAAGVKNLVMIWNISQNIVEKSWDEPEKWELEGYEVRVWLAPDGKSIVVNPHKIKPFYEPRETYYPSVWYDNQDGSEIAILKVDLPSPAPGERVNYHVPLISPVAIAPDGQSTVAYVNIGELKVDGIYLWSRDGASGKRVIGAEGNSQEPVAPILGEFMPDVAPQVMIFSPNGKLLAFSQGTNVKIWDTATWKEVVGMDSAKPETQTPVPTATGDVGVFDFSNAPEFSPLGLSESLVKMQFSPDGTLLVGVSDQGKVWVWRVTDGELLSQFSIDERYAPALISLDISSDGKVIYIGDETGIIHVFGVLN